MKFWERIISSFSTFRIADLLDILIIAYLIYKLLQLVKETRAEQLLKGVLALLILAQLSSFFNLYTLSWLINNLFTAGLLVFIVVFQPELRRAFEKIGRGNGVLRSLINIKDEESVHKSDEIVSAVASLARQKIGALIVLENETGLNEYIETGTRLDADVSSELLINIFIPNTPLHDGAVIIKDEKIEAAGCFLPLSNNSTLSKELGTRHRAAIGLSEVSDALVIVVSEETGQISLAEQSELSRRVDTDTLKRILYDFFENERIDIFSLKKDKRDK